MHFFEVIYKHRVRAHQAKSVFLKKVLEFQFMSFQMLGNF